MRTQEINTTPNKTMAQVINICEAGKKEVAYFLATHHLPLKPLQNPHCFECLNFALLYCVCVQTTEKFWEAYLSTSTLFRGLLAKTRAKSTVTLFSPENKQIKNYTVMDMLSLGPGPCVPWHWDGQRSGLWEPLSPKVMWVSLGDHRDHNSH